MTWKPKRLTALRTAELLEYTDRPSREPDFKHRYERLRERLYEHMKAEIISGQRRRKEEQ